MGATEAFVAELAEMCGPTVSAHDAEAKYTMDFVERVTGGKLGSPCRLVRGAQNSGL